MDLETRIDNLDRKLDLRFDELRAQFTALFANGPISKLDSRVTVLEAQPQCPVQDHSIVLADHTSTLSGIRKTLWLLFAPVAALLVKVLYDVVKHVSGAP